MTLPLTIDDFARGLRDRRFSAAEIAADVLKRIDDDNPRLNAFILVMRDAAHAAGGGSRWRAGGGPRPRTAARRSDLGQGSLRRGGHADHGGLPRPRGARRRARRGRDRPGPQRGCGDRRQDQPPRVCIRHDERRIRFRPGPQPSRPVALARRLERRIGGKRRRRNGAWNDRFRYGRLDPDSGRRLRRRRAEADFRRDRPRWRRPPVAVARSRRADRDDRPRRVAALPRAHRVRVAVRAARNAIAEAGYSSRIFL